MIETRKTISLMPPIVKTNKVTYSDLETPKEIDKDPVIAKKAKEIQGFSDLYPIAEEQTKGKVKNKRNGSQTSNSKKQSSRKGSNTKMNNAVSRGKIGFSKASSDILKLNSPSEETSVKKKNSQLTKGYQTNSKESLCIMPTRLEDKFVSLTVDPSLPPKHTLSTKENRRVCNQFNQPHQRNDKNQNKSNRRNRKERMRSNHSSNRS